MSDQRHSRRSTAPSRRPRSRSISPIAWALLSQTIWLPLVAIDAHDRWQARIRELQPEVASIDAVPAANPATSTDPLSVPGSTGRSSVGLLLGTANQGRDPLMAGLSRSLEVPTSPIPTVPAPATSPKPERSLTRPETLIPSSPRTAAQAPAPTLQFRAPVLSPPDQLLGRFTRSELLGGPIGLADMQAPPMPALAMAERAQIAASDDPLASLPLIWRQPMRRALQQLPSGKGVQPRLQAARVVYVPSSRISTATSVPLAIQPDGSLDIFTRPSDPGVIEEIRIWSGRQPAAPKGVITPAVIHLTPMPRAVTAMISPARSAAAALSTPSAAARPAFQAPPPPLPPLPSSATATPASVGGAAALGTVSLKRAEQPAATATAPSASAAAPISPAPAPAPAVTAAAPAPVAAVEPAPAPAPEATPAATPAPAAAAPAPMTP